MFRRWGSVGTAVAVVLAAWAGASARGADDSPEKAPRPAETAPKPAEAAPKPAEEAPKAADETPATADEAPQSPAEVLAARGLKRMGATYVLEKQEAECFKKFDDVRPLYEKLESSYNRVMAMAMSDAQIAELQAEQAMIQQQIQGLGASGNSMSRYSGRYGSRYSRYGQNPTTQLQQQLRAQQSLLAQQLAVAKQQAVPAKQKQDDTALFQKHRNDLLESSGEVRELFEKLQKEYTDVEAEPPVRTAIGALRKAAKAQLKIAPSAEFNRKLAQLKKLERMMRPESASQPAAKSKGKSKRSARSKR